MPTTSSLTFRKSSYSSGKGEDCVEVANMHKGAAVRDSQHRQAGHLAFPTTEWTAFLRSVQTEDL